MSEKKKMGFFQKTKKQQSYAMILRENLICVWVMGRLLLYNHIIVLCIVLYDGGTVACEICIVFLQNSFTDIYLTNAKTHGIIIKLSHESESQENKGQRKL